METRRQNRDTSTHGGGYGTERPGYERAHEPERPEYDNTGMEVGEGRQIAAHNKDRYGPQIYTQRPPSRRQPFLRYEEMVEPHITQTRRTVDIKEDRVWAYIGRGMDINNSTTSATLVRATSTHSPPSDTLDQQDDYSTEDIREAMPHRQHPNQPQPRRAVPAP